LSEDGTTIGIVLKVSPKTIDVDRNVRDVGILGKSPPCGKSCSDNFVNWILSVPLKDMTIEKVSDRWKNEILLRGIEGPPGLLTFGTLPNVEAIK
jgi:hypothetical protein